MTKYLVKIILSHLSIGVLIENPAFIPEYSAFKNLKVLASINSKVTDDEIKEVLEQVGL